MGTDFSFIDYLLSFDFNASFNFRPYNKGKPVYLKSKMNWDFDKQSEARDFFISKGSYLEPNIPELIILRKRLTYLDYLTKLFNEFKTGFQKSKSESTHESDYTLHLNGQIKKLERSKTRYERKMICFTPEKIEDDYCEELPWHKDFKFNSQSSNSVSSDFTNIGFVNFVISQLIDAQFIITEEALDFLKEESQKITESNEVHALKINTQNEDGLEVILPDDSEEKKFKIIRFKDDTNLLVTLFYDLLDKGYIITTKTNLEKFIIASFTDKNGEPINQSTVNTYLKLGREEKRAQLDKRIIVPER